MRKSCEYIIRGGFEGEISYCSRILKIEEKGREKKKKRKDSYSRNLIFRRILPPRKSSYFEIKISQVFRETRRV